jgi:4-amino-4-deoxy-L-arabinose transferase-like glycosyltransferase
LNGKMLDRLSSAAHPIQEILRRHRAWLLIALTVLFVFIVRVRLRDMPLERDEGEYAYAGQLILQGVPPYKEAYNMKLPGTYAAYAAIMAVFGKSPSGIRLGVALVNAASIVLVFLVGRKLLDEAAGLAAAVAFALLSLSPSVLGLAGHATHFVVVAALGGTWLLLSGLERPNLKGPRPTILIGASGLLLGLAFLMKQHGVFFGLFGGMYLAWVRSREWLAASSVLSQQPGVRSLRERTRFDFKSPSSLAGLTRFIRDLGCFTVGWLLPYALTCVVLWGAGVLPQFMFWTITYAGKYASAVSLVNGADMLRSGLHVVVGPNILFWMLPWVGALVMWWEQRLDTSSLKSKVQSPKSAVQDLRSYTGTAEAGIQQTPLGNRKSQIQYPRFFLMTFLFCSFASTSVGVYFRSHYFITLLPALALLTGVAVSRALHLLKHDQTIELFLALAILGLFTIAVGAALIGHGSVWLGMSESQATRSVFGSTLFAETARAADYVKSHSPKDARVAVLGSEPEIYFLSGRHSASGHIYMYPLMENHPYASKMQNEMIGEIERARPEYVLYVDDEYSWLPQGGSERRIANWWKGYWAANMDLVSTLKVEEGKERGTDLDRPAKDEPTVKHILIFKRRH